MRLSNLLTSGLSESASRLIGELNVALIILRGCFCCSIQLVTTCSDVRYGSHCAGNIDFSMNLLKEIKDLRQQRRLLLVMALMKINCSSVKANLSASTW